MVAEELREWLDPESQWVGSIPAFPATLCGLVIVGAVGLGLILTRMGADTGESSSAVSLSATTVDKSDFNRLRLSLLGRKVSWDDVIENLVGKALLLYDGPDGASYSQAVRLTSGSVRTVYFEISPDEKLILDRGSLEGQSSLLWESLVSQMSMTQTNSVSEALAGLNGQDDIDFGPCRVYVRPHDYYRPEFSPATDLCIRIEDVNRQFSTTAYTPRDSAAGRNLLRLLGAQHFSRSDGLPGRRTWTERAMILSLRVMPSPTQEPPIFMIDEVVSDSWLAASIR